MIIGIDAHNIRGHGGGFVHLYELLSNVEPKDFGITKIIVWSNKNTLNKLPNSNFLEKEQHKYLEKNIAFRLFWQIFLLKKLATKKKCDILFVPGGLYLSRFKPYVVMAQNLLPFDHEARKIYKGTLHFYKIILQEYLLKYSFSNSNGIIFISNSSREIILNKFNSLKIQNKVIYHGVSERFLFKRKRNIRDEKRILIVADLSLHKGYAQLIDSLIELSKDNYNFNVNIVGGLSNISSKKILTEINTKISNYNFITYLGQVDYNEMPEIYYKNDFFIFASYCEAFGMPLTEAMAANLSIACSDIPAFREILDEKGIFFKLKDKDSMLNVFKLLLNQQPNKLEENSQGIKIKYDWEKKRKETFNYLNSIIKKNKLLNILGNKLL